MTPPRETRWQTVNTNINLMSKGTALLARSRLRFPKWLPSDGPVTLVVHGRSADRVTGETGNGWVTVLPVLATVSCSRSTWRWYRVRAIACFGAKPLPLSSLCVTTTRPTTPHYCVGNSHDFPVPLGFGQACPLSQICSTRIIYALEQARIEFA